jgi:predicted transcriptional regulator
MLSPLRRDTNHSSRTQELTSGTETQLETLLQQQVRMQESFFKMEDIMNTMSMKLTSLTSTSATSSATFSILNQPSESTLPNPETTQSEEEQVYQMIPDVSDWRKVREQWVKGSSGMLPLKDWHPKDILPRQAATYSRRKTIGTYIDNFSGTEDEKIAKFERELADNSIPSKVSVTGCIKFIQSKKKE